MLAKSEGMKKAKDIEKLAPIPANGSKPQSLDIIESKGSDPSI